jgi:hypothetical protein
VDHESLEKNESRERGRSRWLGDYLSRFSRPFASFVIQTSAGPQETREAQQAMDCDPSPARGALHGRCAARAQPGTPSHVRCTGAISSTPPVRCTCGPCDAPFLSHPRAPHQRQVQRTPGSPGALHAPEKRPRMPVAQSGPCRPPIPTDVVHLFRAMSSSRSDARHPLFPQRRNRDSPGIRAAACLLVAWPAAGYFSLRTSPEPILQLQMGSRSSAPSWKVTQRYLWTHSIDGIIAWRR